MATTGTGHRADGHRRRRRSSKNSRPLGALPDDFPGICSTDPPSACSCGPKKTHVATLGFEAFSSIQEGTDGLFFVKLSPANPSRRLPRIVGGFLNGAVEFRSGTRSSNVTAPIPGFQAYFLNSDIPLYAAPMKPRCLSMKTVSVFAKTHPEVCALRISTYLSKQRGISDSMQPLEALTTRTSCFETFWQQGKPNANAISRDGDLDRGHRDKQPDGRRHAGVLVGRTSPPVDEKFESMAFSFGRHRFIAEEYTLVIRSEVGAALSQESEANNLRVIYRGPELWVVVNDHVVAYDSDIHGLSSTG